MVATVSCKDDNNNDSMAMEALTSLEPTTRSNGKDQQ
jgi:hypothetical protein